MRLNKVEFAAMNNPIRRLMQRRLEFRTFKGSLKEHNIDLKGKIILDAGCGSGYSSQLIINEFNPAKLVAFDFMPEQIELAKKRFLNADFFIGDATRMELASESFDAVFIFGILHHIPQWKKAVSEVARVLKGQGVLLVEEISRSGVLFFNRLGFIHPKDALFDWPEFREELVLNGFEILEEKNIILKRFKSFLCLKK